MSVPKAAIRKSTKAATPRGSGKKKPFTAKQAAAREQSSMRRKLATRRKLLAAARRLFVQHGYHVTRPQDIAKEAGLGYGTFYDNFEDKLDCYIAFVKDANHEMLRVLEWRWPEADPEEPADFLLLMVETFMEYASINPGVLSAALADIGLLSGDKTQGILKHERLINYLKKWQQAGKISPDFDLELFAYLISGIIRLGDSLVSRDPGNYHKVAKGLTRFIVHAIDAADNVDMNVKRARSRK